MHNDTVIAGNIQSSGKVRKGKIVVAASGLIKEIIYVDEGNIKADYEYDDNHIIAAGDINAHSHPEQSLYTDLVDKGWDLATWCRNTIYKYSPYLQEEHIYLACCRAFSRMLSYGVTSAFVSFYCHNNKGNRYDRAVIRAATDTGIRLYFGRMNYDIITPDAYEAKKKSQHCYYETIKEAESNFSGLYEEAGSDTVVIAPAIHSIHASTGAAVENALRLGSIHDRYIQFHLSEDSGDVDLSMKWYGMRPVEYLASLVEKGLVNSLDNLLLSDCIWVNEKELDLIKYYDMKVVLNPRMNERIKAGEAKLLEFMKRGIPLYLGTDGEASNDDLSITGELSYLQRKHPNIGTDLKAYFASEPLKFGAECIGKLEKGCHCDLKVLKNGKLVDVFVGGRKVLDAGVLVSMDLEKDIEKPLQSAVAALVQQHI